jgi:hypothetical protein
LRWSIATLAQGAGVGISTVQEIEKVDGSAMIESDLQWRTDARAEAVAKITAALEAAGVTFLPETAAGPGLRCKSG